MQTWIALLRGINVSGQKKIKMEQLRKELSELEFQDIRTYIQSGNIIFKSKSGNEKELAAKIKANIHTNYGFEVPVLVKNSDEIKRALNANPFTEADTTKLHLTFLEENPRTNLINTINNTSYYPDEFEVIGKTVYVFCPDGYGKTKLNNNFFENKLKLPATTRNWKTASTLMQMAENG